VLLCRVVLFLVIILYHVSLTTTHHHHHQRGRRRKRSKVDVRKSDEKRERERERERRTMASSSPASTRVRKYLKMYQDALQRHEMQAEQFAMEVELLSSSTAAAVAAKTVVANPGEDDSEEEEEGEGKGFVSPRSRKLLRVGRGVDGVGRRKRYAKGISPPDEEQEQEENEEEEENERRMRSRRNRTMSSSSLSLLGLADFTYFTRSALLVAAAKFYDLGNYSELTETTTAEDSSNSISSSDRKKEFESIIAVASVHALFVLVSDVLAQKNYVENAFDAIVSVVLRVFALLLGTAAWFGLAFLFASISTVTSETQRATLAFAYFMSSLTVLPGTHAASAQALVRTINTRKQQRQQDRRRRAATSTTTVEAIFMPALRVIAFVKLVERNFHRVIIERRFRSDFDAFFRATLIGSVVFAWVGGLLAPLDWSTEWHKYPTLSVRLAIIGHILGTVLTAVFAWLDRTLPEKMK